jgi:mRNA-degrading endonuclease toxin of MazEF toxin-antitoxin module
MAKYFDPLPAPGDIVWCLFPETVGQPGPKPRPALVLAVAPALKAITVAYGTSQKTDRIYPTEFLIDSTDPNFALTGLSVPTKFDMAHQVQIPFSADWVTKAPSPLPNIPLPKLGVLPANLVKAAREAAGKRK